jgi:hypothetical protein
VSEKPGNAGSYTVADTVSSTNLTFASQGVTLTVHANDAIRPGTFLKNSGKNAFSIRSESNGKVLITSLAGVLIMKDGMIFLRKKIERCIFICDWAAENIHCYGIQGVRIHAQQRKA